MENRKIKIAITDADEIETDDFGDETDNADFTS